MLEKFRKKVQNQHKPGDPRMAKPPQGIHIGSAQIGVAAEFVIPEIAELTDVAVLQFAPLSPWMDLDTTTGKIILDCQDQNHKTGKFYFAVRGGDSEGRIRVFEYYAGLYQNDEKELNNAKSYYYDPDSGQYEIRM